MKLSEAVSLYIKLRDKKAAMKKEFEASIAPLNEKMDKLEAKLLEVFNTTGMESVRTEFGTAYSSVRSSATVADRDSFISYVRSHDDWALLEVRPAKLAIEEFRSANDGGLPPGINFTEERVVNVRRTA
jgi:hypothetical protein